MSKYFWNTIIILVFLSIVLIIFALINQEKIKESISKTPITKELEGVLTQTIKENIQAYQNDILQNLETTKKDIDWIITNNIDQFIDDIIAKNLDNYLNFHYSVIGEYKQLFAMVFGNMNKIIKEKLLGDDFEKNIAILSQTIIDNSYLKIKQHLQNTQNIATKNVDIELNQDSLTNLKLNIENNLKTNLIDIKATLLTTAIATKLAISIASKISAKVAIKSSGKTAAKLATSTTAASVGIACGIAAPLCGVALGSVAWFTTDAVVISADEYFNKDSFKQEIIDSLKQTKLELKEQYRPILDELYQISNDYQEILKDTKTLEKRRVIDNIRRFFLNN